MNEQLEGIGKMIKFARESRGLSQQALADACGLRQATIADIETGKQNWSIKTMVAIINALNYHLDISLTPAGD